MAPGGLVFPSPTFTDRPEAVWNRRNLHRLVRLTLDGAGFNWAVGHTLRRTVATVASKAGIPLVQIADALGHADPSMTQRVYLGRDFKGDRRDLADAL